MRALLAAAAMLLGAIGQPSIADTRRHSPDQSQNGVAISRTWDYSTDIDKMSGKQVQMAFLTSGNSLDLRPPYDGVNHGLLMVRKHPLNGLDVSMSISKGQIVCTVGCSIKVRFGDRAPVTFSASTSQDYDARAIFINNPRSFIDQASKVRTIRMQMNIYRAGAPVIEFESSDPLVWGQQAK